MTFTKDSPLAWRVVEAPDQWSRVGAPILAIVIHMAEGGGTVSWLTRDDGNSSHYVVEYDGRITQMVPESKAAGSMNPRLTRTTDDRAYTYLGESIRYGVTALKKSLGQYWDRPNNAAIAIETEGFAGKPPASYTDSRANPDGGPNDKQRAALAALVSDIRRRRGNLPCLGHRDQQDYKPCPGHRIPWVDYGGHAVAAGPDTHKETGMDFRGLSAISGAATIKAGRGLVNLVTGQDVVPANQDFKVYGRVALQQPYEGGDETRQKGYLVNYEKQAHIMLDAVTETFAEDAPQPAPAPDCTAAVAEAVEAEHERIALAEAARIRGI